MLSLFLILRIIEAAVFVASLIAFGKMHALELPESLRSPLNIAEVTTSWMIVRTYYIQLGYLLFSAIAFLAAGVIAREVTRKRVVALNVGVFLAHSLALVAIVFEGQIGAYLWGVWIVVAVCDAFAPIWLLRRN